MANRQRTFDLLGYLHGVGVVAALAAGTAWDTGGGYTEAMLVLDVTAVSTLATTGNKFEIRFQGSTTSTFTVYHTFFAIPFGRIGTNMSRYWGLAAPAATCGAFSSLATWPGPVALPLRITQPVCNDHAGTVYRWVRTYSMMGTVSTGINYYATLCQLH